MISEKVQDIAKRAKKASRKLGTLSTIVKNDALLKMAGGLEGCREYLQEENKKDLVAGREKGLSKAMIDRLTLDDKRIKGMAEGLRGVAALPDPVGEITGMKTRPNGLRIGRMRAALGVVGIIYESRPNVTADAAGLCLKSGNAVILRGGSESIHSNKAISKVLSDALVGSEVPQGAVQLIDITDRQAVLDMLTLDRHIDLIIPRGGYGLIRFVTENSTIPVIKHDRGVCHTYIDRDADKEKAIAIAFDAKVDRPGVCNAMENLLIHRERAQELLPPIVEKLESRGVELRGCARCLQLIPSMKAATDDDWDEEYLDLILSVKIVNSMEEAMDFIAAHGSMHSEAIITENHGRGWRFLEGVDAAAVYINASTRFTDGAEFGMGAEMGISNQKLHCRGPMGLEELTATKFIVLGDGQVRG